MKKLNQHARNVISYKLEKAGKEILVVLVLLFLTISALTVVIVTVEVIKGVPFEDLRTEIYTALPSVICLITYLAYQLYKFISFIKNNLE